MVRGLLRQAEAQTKRQLSFESCLFIWSGRRDSNSLNHPTKGKPFAGAPLPPWIKSAFGTGGGSEFVFARSRASIRSEAENCHRRNSLPPLNDEMVRGLLRQAEAQTKRQLSFESCLFIWSGRRDSNSLPPPWQGGALPNELRPHLAVRKLFYHKKHLCQVYFS